MLLDLVVEHVHSAGWGDVLGGALFALGFAATLILLVFTSETVRDVVRDWWRGP